MSTAREPNPLRPYYNPPPIGKTPDVHHNTPSVPNISSKHASSANSFGTSARNILADMDYSDYMSDSPPAASDFIKGLVEQALWRYTSVFLAQPFEVAKTVLQVHVAAGKQKSIVRDGLADNGRRRQGAYRRDSYDPVSSDSDLDSPSYFTSSAPLPHTPTRAPRGRRRRASPSPEGIPRVHPPQSPPSTVSFPHLLDLKSSSSVFATLSTLWNAEGAWGIWKGTNSTYIYSILFSTITSFVRSFFSALLALPDPGLSFTSTSLGPTSYAGGLDILSSPSPLASLAVAVSAAGIAGAILAPLDTARTKLILTSSTHPPRSIIATLKTLPSWTLPFSLAPTAILHSTLSTFLSASTPLFLRSKMGIEPLLTPNLYAIATFCSQVVELVVKLPIETVLRRGQIDVARSTSKGRESQTIVEVGPYRGLFGTMRSILYEEGERGVSTPADVPKGGKGAPGMKVGKAGLQRRKDQGIEGWYRGWRVGMWGLVGVWGATTLGGVGGKGGEF
ncbi:MAG: hypothetical protein Q9217_006966 [Psora testacea]